MCLESSDLRTKLQVALNNQLSILGQLLCSGAVHSHLLCNPHLRDLSMQIQVMLCYNVYRKRRCVHFSVSHPMFVGCQQQVACNLKLQVERFE